MASPTAANPQTPQPADIADNPTDTEQFETLLQAIESSGIDLTSEYSDWFRIGTAIASTYHEQGRDYFHRISKLYSGYTYSEADKKYNQCLSDSNPQVTIATIYHLAKNAGITLPTLPRKTQTPQPADIAVSADIADFTATPLPTFSLSPEAFPPLMADIYRADSNPTTADMLTFGSIIALSAVMPNVCGIYGRKRVYANLFGFVAAPPASSKGKLADVIRIVQPIQDEIRATNEQEQLAYQEQLAAYKAAGDRNALPPTLPKYRTLKIAANAIMKYLPTTSPLRPRVDRHSTDTRPTPVTLRHQLIIDHLFMARLSGIYIVESALSRSLLALGSHRWL